MSRTTRKMIFTDPILRKGHAHAVKLKEPDVDEQMDEFFAELDEELEQQAQDEWAQWLDEECERG
jgi:hypothetical protein